MLANRGSCQMPPRWLYTPSSRVQTMLTEAAHEQPCVDATKEAAHGRSPRWRRAALALARAWKSATAARSSPYDIVTVAVAATVTWTAPTGGRSAAPEGAWRARGWTPKSTPIESQKSKHVTARAVAARNRWRRRRKLPKQPAAVICSLDCLPFVPPGPRTTTNTKIQISLLLSY